MSVIIHTQAHPRSYFLDSPHYIKLDSKNTIENMNSNTVLQR